MFTCQKSSSSNNLLTQSCLLIPVSHVVVRYLVHRNWTTSKIQCFVTIINQSLLTTITMNSHFRCSRSLDIHLNSVHKKRTKKSQFSRIKYFVSELVKRQQHYICMYACIFYLLSVKLSRIYIENTQLIKTDPKIGNF